MPIESGTCLVGSELRGKSNKPPRTCKTDIRILPRYNKFYCVLEYGAMCEIVKSVHQLSREEYLECLNVIRINGYEPKEVVGVPPIMGSEVSCEFDNKISHFKGNQWVTFKGKIAIGTLNKPFSRGGFYKSSDIHVGAPKFQLK